MLKNKFSTIGSETINTSRQTPFLGSNKQGSKGTLKIPSPVPKKHVSIQHHQSVKSINLKDRLTENMVNNSNKK